MTGPDALSLVIDPLPLPPGHYGLTLSLIQNGECVRDGAHVLRVRPAESESIDNPYRLDARADQIPS